MNQMTTEQLTTFDALLARGLRAGPGHNSKGQVCLLQAIALSMGEDLTDKASCVAVADRRFAIGLNDARWSSPKIRADALRPLALAQLGTAGTDRVPWVRRLVIGTVARVLPMALRARGYSAEATRCERATTLDDARSASAFSADFAIASAASAADFAASAASAASAAIIFP